VAAQTPVHGTCLPDEMIDSHSTVSIMTYSLTTPYYCRLGDLLCFAFMYAYCVFFCKLCNLRVCLQYFDTVGWVF